MDWSGETSGRHEPVGSSSHASRICVIRCFRFLFWYLTCTGSPDFDPLLPKPVSDICDELSPSAP
jgi:hypothetical protein